MDGTFKIAPSLCSQLYSLHGLYMHEYFPFAYAILQDKSEETYARLFDFLKAAAVERHLLLAPERITVDFKMAAINAAIPAFPDTDVKGCLFHYTQCIWRKVCTEMLLLGYISTLLTATVLEAQKFL
jgi:hypothetical protein